MSFKDELRKKIPERLHADPDCRALFDTVALKGLNSKEELNNYLDAEIKAVRDLLKTNQTVGGTAVKDIRDKIVKLECLEHCKTICQEFL